MYVSCILYSIISDNTPAKKTLKKSAVPSIFPTKSIKTPTPLSAERAMRCARRLNLRTPCTSITTEDAAENSIDSIDTPLIQVDISREAEVVTIIEEDEDEIEVMPLDVSKLDTSTMNDQSFESLAFQNDGVPNAINFEEVEETSENIEYNISLTKLTHTLIAGVDIKPVTLKAMMDIDDIKNKPEFFYRSIFGLFLNI